MISVIDDKVIIKMLIHYANGQLPASPPIFTPEIFWRQKCSAEEIIYVKGKKNILPL
jgi:hypothetical protein